MNQVGFGLGAQAGAHSADFFDGSRQPVDDRLQFGGAALASSRFALAHAGGVGFARALFGLLLQLREVCPGIGLLFRIDAGAGRSGGMHLTPDQSLDAGGLVRLADLRRHTAHPPRPSG